MDCKRAEELLIDFLYEELAPSDREAFELHLKQCPPHANEVEKLKTMLTLVRKQPQQDMPTEQIERILKTAKAAMPDRPKPFLLRWSPVAATAVLAGVLLTVGIAVVHQPKQVPENDFIAAPPKEAPRVESIQPASDESKGQNLAWQDAKKAELEDTTLPLPKKKSRRTVRKSHVSSRPSQRSKRGKKIQTPRRDFEKIEKKPATTQEKSSLDLRSAPKAAGARGLRSLPVEPPEMVHEIHKKSLPPKIALEADSLTQPKPMTGAKPARTRSAQSHESDLDLYQAAEEQMAQKRYTAAISLYRTFLDRSPSDLRVSTCRFRMAKAMFLAGRCKKAIPAIDQAIRASPQHALAAPALLDQASCLVRLKRFDQASRVYQRIEQAYPAYRREARQGIQRIQPPVLESDIKKSD